MKHKLKLLSLIFASVFAFSNHAQAQASWAVLAEQIAEQAVNYVQYTEQTVQMVSTAKNTFDTVTNLKDLKKTFGDPATILSLDGITSVFDNASMLGPVADDLSTLYSTISGAGVFATNFGNLGNVDSNVTISNPDGTESSVARNVARTKSVDASVQEVQRLRTIRDDTNSRRLQIREDMAKTLEQLKNATTDAEVQKLQGVLIAQGAMLRSVENDVRLADSEAEARNLEIKAYDQTRKQAGAETSSVTITTGITRAADNFKIARPSSYPTLP